MNVQFHLLINTNSPIEIAQQSSSSSAGSNKRISKDILISLPLYLKVVDPDAQFHDSSALLERYMSFLWTRNMPNEELPVPSDDGNLNEDCNKSTFDSHSQETAPNETISTSTVHSLSYRDDRLLDLHRDLLFGSMLFSVRLFPKMRELDAVSVIDEHQQNLAKLDDAIQQERLKQELELHETLASQLQQQSDGSSLTLASPRIGLANALSEDEENEAQTRKGIEEKISSLNQTRSLRMRKRSPSLVTKTIANEVHSSRLLRDVAMKGYLKKKGTVHRVWKTFWFVLSRPYLFYYTSETLENEKVIDLTNSVVVPLVESQSPLSFTIVTWKRAWLLQAPNDESLEQWIGALDPSLNSKEKLELQHRVRILEEQLTDREIYSSGLKNENELLRERAVEMQQQFRVFCMSMGKRLEALKERLAIREQEQHIQGTLNFNNQEGKSEKLSSQPTPLEQTSLSMESSIPMSSELSRSLERNCSQQALRNEIVSLTASLERRQQEWHLKQEDFQVQCELEVQQSSNLLQELNDARKQIDLQRQKIYEMQALLETSRKPPHLTELVDKQIETSPMEFPEFEELQELRRQQGFLQTELKHLENELIEKDYQCELSCAQIKNIEDQKKQIELVSDQLQIKLKLLQEELAAKDELLNEKFNIKIPQIEVEESWTKKIFGSSLSRVDFLEKQLIQSKKANLAHQTHNAFLSMEVTRLEREMKLQIEVRHHTIERLKKEINLLRKRLMNISKENGQRMSCISSNAPIEHSEVTMILETLKKKYFLNCVVGVKMNMYGEGFTCNTNAQQVWEEAIASGINDFEDYPDFIHAKLYKNAIPLPSE